MSKREQNRKAKILKDLRQALARARKRGGIVPGFKMPAEWRGK